MEQLKEMKECLTTCVQAQMGNLANVNTKELGEAVDMIKDLAEAMYYCSITKAMEDSEKEKEAMRYIRPVYMNDRYEEEPMRYYNGGNNSGRGGSSSYAYNGGNTGSRTGNRMYFHEGMMDTYPRYMEDSYPMEIRDYREGKSPVSRRMYMESKELHHDKGKQMKELEKYMRELSEDITEMIDDATPEEKAILSQKLVTLADKVR